MAEEILINVTSREVRVALLKNKVLEEIYIERNLRQSILGNIYKGKVNRLLPGIQAAFVDIGLERAAFLHVSDIQTNQVEQDIGSLLRPGQEILVQVYKEPLGGKGARITTQFTLPARFLVLTPGVQQITVSQKITDEALRQQLLNKITPSADGGYIFRTVASEVTVSEIEADKEYLRKVWEQIKIRNKQVKAGEIVYEEIPVLFRLLRDLASHEIATIRVDHQQTVISMRDFAARSVPGLVPRIEYYADDRPIFDICGVEKELQQLLQRKIDLKSGGHVVFDQTEAMTTIDVNTGSYVGHNSVEHTSFNTNLEAAEMIARQVRLRNLGGIIIIDFIDMVTTKHKEKLLAALIAALAKDSVRTEISELSSLGLVQMTRKRTRESLEHILCVACPTCQQRGSVKSLETVCYDIFRELKRTAGNYDWPGFLVLATKEVITYLSDKESIMLMELERELGRPIGLRVESSYTQEQYDILPKECAL